MMKQKAVYCLQKQFKEDIIRRLEKSEQKI